MKYQLKEYCFGDGRGEVSIQCRILWRWHTIWKRPYAAPDRDYVLLCAEEVKEKLEAEI